MANRTISSDGEGEFDGIPGVHTVPGVKKAFVVNDLDLVTFGAAQAEGIEKDSSFEGEVQLTAGVGRATSTWTSARI